MITYTNCTPLSSITVINWLALSRSECRNFLSNIIKSVIKSKLTDRQKAGADPEFFLGGCAPVSNGVTDW